MAEGEQSLQSDVAGTSKPTTAESLTPSNEVLCSCGDEYQPNAQVMLPVMYPLLVPGMSHSLGNQEPVVDHGPGLYAVPTHSFSGTMSGFSSNDLIPLRYKIPTRQDPAGAASFEQGQAAREQQGPQRHPAARRVQFALRNNLFLILKLLAVVILFSQDGSRQRLITLMLFACVVYLHQTGALAPLVRWLHQQATPPQPQHAARPANGPLPPDIVNAQGEDQNQPDDPVENRNPEEDPVENRNPEEAVDRGNGGNMWAIVREIRMIVLGFIGSLLPGFHQHND